MPKSDARERILSVEHISKSFPAGKGANAVLNGVSFELSLGETVVITGRSGAGKSTLLSLIAGIDRPDTGSIILDSNRFEDLTNAGLAELRRKSIGMIFQNFNLLPSWTAAENVESILMHSGMNADARSAKVNSILNALGLGDRLDSLPSELSIGQQQRVAVARTLVNEPVLILADEPTGNVDSETSREVISLLLEPVRKGTAALIAVTHGNFPLSDADRVYSLKNGRLEGDQA